MVDSDKEVLSRIKSIILKIAHGHEGDLVIFTRLAESLVAQNAWLRLSKKSSFIINGIDFYYIIPFIALPACQPNLALAEKRTAREIRDASVKASLLAKELRLLILNNSSLRNGLTKHDDLFEEKSSDERFIESLEDFELTAKESGEYKPIFSKPNTDLADVHSLALQLTYTVNYFFNAPHHEAVAGFCSAIYEKDIDAETVKKWWQRGKNRDNT